MEEIFLRAKQILIIWGNNVNTDDLPPFQQRIQEKAPYATICFHNVHMLTASPRKSSDFDLILFGLVSNKDIPIDIDLINECFRLLRPDGRLITHIENNSVRTTINNFKMCGFISCQPLDSNSSFLMDNKDTLIKRLGTLWLCDKPAFDIGFSIPLKTTRSSPIKTVVSPSPLNNQKKTWTVDDDDLIDTDELLDENDRKKPDVKKYDCGTSSSGVRKACKNCSCGLAQELEQEEHQAAKQTVKSSCGSCYLGDAFRCAGCPARGLPPFKPGERVIVPNMSDV